MAASSIDNQLLRYGAKDHFFRAALCRMCLDLQDASSTMSKYEEQFPAFSDSRECKLVKVSSSFVQIAVDPWTEYKNATFLDPQTQSLVKIADVD